jgi:hypothetical protein
MLVHEENLTFAKEIPGAGGSALGRFSDPSHTVSELSGVSKSHAISRSLHCRVTGDGVCLDSAQSNTLEAAKPLQQNVPPRHMYTERPDPGLYTPSIPVSIPVFSLLRAYVPVRTDTKCDKVACVRRRVIVGYSWGHDPRNQSNKGGVI